MIDKANDISLRSGFLHNASLHPDAPAVAVRGVVRCYGELEYTARRWANAIVKGQCSQPERVGLFAHRSEVSYIGTLAALFAGATFVPLNLTFPLEKTAMMIRQADLDAIIVDKSCMPQARNLLGHISDSCSLVVPELEVTQIPGSGERRTIGKRELDHISPLERLPPITPEDVAYLLFTSGSTGDPKGVPVTHGNVMHFINVMSRRYQIQADDRFSQTFDQTFDLSVFDLFMSWNNGACVYSMAPQDLLYPTKFINQNQITVWFSVPSVPAQMIRRNTLLPNGLPTLRWSLFCGEALKQSTAEGWQQAAPNSILENLYGPTELSIACFVHRWDSVKSPQMCRNGLVPIGRPYDGLAVMVVDDKLEPVQEGEMGELCVSGPQTTPGYWRAPEKTAERYVNLSVSRMETRRFYRTGDVVTRLPEGEYAFLGRTDHQIKVLGHRVELGEIEAVLRNHPEVEHAVAFGWPVSTSTAETVVAFVSGNTPSVDELVRLAKANLPPYMVPRKIFMIVDMPLNANGKVDRRTLGDRLLTMSV